MFFFLSEILINFGRMQLEILVGKNVCWKIIFGTCLLENACWKMLVGKYLLENVCWKMLVGKCFLENASGKCLLENVFWKCLLENVCCQYSWPDENPMLSLKLTSCWEKLRLYAVGFPPSNAPEIQFRLKKTSR